MASRLSMDFGMSIGSELMKMRTDGGWSARATATLDPYVR
jgi:hypothetical protein